MSTLEQTFYLTLEKALGALPQELSSKYDFKKKYQWTPPKINKPQDISFAIDHTSLKAAVTLEDIKSLAKEAKDNFFYSICINSLWAEEAKKLVDKTEVKLCIVVNFPLGSSDLNTTKENTLFCEKIGVDEIDMVLPIGLLKSKQYLEVYDYICSIKSLWKNKNLKLILETSLLDKEEMICASIIGFLAGADFLKTSTGFAGGGASVEDVSWMRTVVADRANVKASGGVKTYEQAVAMLNAGANRIGTSSGLSIVGNSVGLGKSTGDY